MHIAEQLLDDRSAGLKTDLSGRRYFRQRRVVFQTIGLEAEDLADGPWLGFEHALEPLDWSGYPAHEEIREYSRLSSERFLAFWYRVCDVSVARALSGRGREIFRTDFFRPSSLLDIGIPVEQTFSTVPPALHKKIIEEYDGSRARPVAERVFYLSDYLTGLTDDVRSVLAPFTNLWDLHAERRAYQGRLEQVPSRLKEIWSGFASGNETLHARLLRRLDEYLSDTLATLPKRRVREIQNESVRHLVYRLQSGQDRVLRPPERGEVFTAAAELRLPAAAVRLYRALNRPDRFLRLLGSAMVQDAAAYRLALRLTRTRYLHNRYGREANTETILKRLALHRKNFRDRLLFLQRERTPAGEARLAGELAALHALALRERSAGRISGAELLAFDPRSRAGARGDSGPGDPVHAELALTRDAFDDLLRLRAAEARIVRIHHDHAHAAPPPASDAENEAPVAMSAGDARYHGRERFFLPRDLTPGNPFHEFQILRIARELLLGRLRPVRRTTSFYSLNPGHRHGAMTLNPIMKLWKDRPGGAARDLPRLAGLEINTRQTVACLLRLACLVDPELEARRLFRFGAGRDKKNDETLSTLSTFLLPGSAYPLREIHRLDFPEFRGRVIGESRSPIELGVPPEEDAVLTGAWYQKNNHTLYYPVGGDNGGLVRLVWLSGHAGGPPAFFFALGQFVHDCLPESVTYYRSGEMTFRECVEDYYKMEDRIRKNRDEKTGRRHLDNSRAAVRFMFAVCYARIMLEALTGSSQSSFRHRPTERWLSRHIGLPILGADDRDRLRLARTRAREVIQEWDTV